MGILSGIALVIVVVVWVALQIKMKRDGIEPLSEGQLRYMRKKARKQGVSISQVNYKPRRR